MTLDHTHNRRILIVDDNEDIHDAPTAEAEVSRAAAAYLDVKPEK